MIVYYAGVDSNPKDIVDAFNAGARHFMISYYYWKKHRTPLRTIRQRGAHVMLDSGAFSAWKKGESINVEDYVNYIRAGCVGKYVVLDVVGDPEETDFNQRTMEESGLYPIPVFHIGSKWERLDMLAGKYPLIALGGTVGRSRTERETFFDEVFARHPETCYHGLGMTIPALMRKYPWMSVDSTTWLTGKKNAMLVTDSGQIPMDGRMSVSERVAVNVRYFRGFEDEIV